MNRIFLFLLLLLISQGCVKKIPPPKGDPEAPLQAIIFDSIFDPYRGAIAYVRIFNGTLNTQDKIKYFATDKIMMAEEIGVLGLKKVKTKTNGF